MMRLALAAAALCLPSVARAAEQDAQAVEFFENKIRPVLVEHCYKCHSEDAAKAGKLKAGLKLDTKAHTLKGGDTGPAVVAGKPADSLLLKSLKYEGELQMPPKGKLPDAVVKDFEKWIAAGAVDPRGGEIAKPVGIDIEKGKKFWSFVPPKEPALPTAPNAHTPIDKFVAARWAEKGLTPVSAADKLTLVRRAAFDLTGLPPAPELVEAYLKDTSPDAFRRVVDELLASPAYGEKWARHWLDVARYAEDQAHTFGVKPKTQAWRYRDWVIQALNADMPYDTFVKLQLAGDLVSDAPADPFTKFAGLGFIGLGAEYYKNTAAAQAIAEELDDRVDTITRGFLGLTVSCARCHDHKFDPIPTKDYYSLAGIYMGTNFSDAPLCPPHEVKAFNDAQNGLKTAEAKMKKVQDDQKAKSGGFVARFAAPHLVRAMTADIAARKKAMPAAPPVAHTVSGNGAGMKVYLRGNPATQGEVAPKGFLQVLPSSAKSGTGYGRLELAEAIASKDNPLTARVIVNRVWAWHFGRGLVNTPSNFGALGDKPSHPELLDWLAVNFVKNGWSMKWLHRQIMNSATYQLESKPNAGNDAIDAANVYLWRGTRKRLLVEDWRDSLLAVSGTLSTQVGGPTFDLRDASATRRTVYAKVSRHELNGLLRLFDFPDANVTADKRTITTVPQQQLFALNSDFMVNQAKAFAARAEKLGTTAEERVRAAYRLAFGRAPERAELELATKFLELPPKTDDKLTRWQQFAQVLLASNELMYVD
jgi:hypothetical protein